MIIQEHRSEQRINLLEQAEQSALGKIADIRQPIFQKHSFVRFGPLFIDDGRNGRWTSYPNYVWDNRRVANPEVDRLESIFRYGIVAEKFAKRVGLTLSRNWSDPRNESSVSLGLREQDLELMFSIGTLAATHNNRAIQIPRENIFTLLIDDKYYRYKQKYVGILNMPRSIFRVPMKSFRGIVFIDRAVDKFRHDFLNYIDFNATTVQETVDIVVTKMLEVNKDKPHLYIPVYGLSGDLYWPKRLKYEEVKALAQDTEAMRK
ncbi:MAG: hypothetical protein HYT07_03060 [Candidatus Levybacteria bacterium]|nr:hypothetical protein [Candidatus Levybacteria bacterium]